MTSYFVENVTLIPPKPIYPTFFNYVTLVPYLISAFICKQLSIVDSVKDFHLLIELGSTLPLISLRITSLFCSLCSMLLVYIIGKNHFNKNVGLIAALMFLCSVINLQYSVYALPESLLTFLSLLVVYCSLKGQKENKFKMIYFAAIFTGMVSATKYHGAIIFVVIPLCIFSFDKLNTYKKIALVLKAGAVSLISFIVCSPVVLNISLLKKVLVEHYAITVDGHGNWYNSFPPFFGFFNYFYRSEGITIFILLLVLYYSYIFLKKNKPALILTITFMFVFICYGFFGRQELRYIIFVLPVLYLIISCFVTLYPHKRHPLILLLIFAVVFSLPIQRFHKQMNYKIKNLFKLDANSLAVNWINNNLSQGDKIITSNITCGLVDIKQAEKYKLSNKKFYDKYIVNRKHFNIVKLYPFKKIHKPNNLINNYEYFAVPHYVINMASRCENLGNKPIYDALLGNTAGSNWRRIEEMESKGLVYYIYKNQKTQ